MTTETTATLKRISGEPWADGLQTRFDAAWVDVLEFKDSMRLPLRMTLDDLANIIGAQYETSLFDEDELRQSEGEALEVLTRPVTERFHEALQAALRTCRTELEAAIIEFKATHPDAPFRTVGS